MKKIRIAIDGPAGAGKSTIAKYVAKNLGISYFDTGAMYRTVALAALRKNIDPKREEDLQSLLDGVNVTTKHISDNMHIFLNGEDVTMSIRTKEVSLASSDIAIHKCVREKMVTLQRDMAKSQSVVMDGRDIGSFVLKDADIKIFLTATSEDRAYRRLLELQEKGQDPIYEDVLKDIVYRDMNDSTRDIAPLIQAEDAYVFNTTGNTLDETKKLIYDFVLEEIEIIKYAFSRKVVVFFARSLLNIFYRIKITGTENVPENGALIVCANHTSYADVPLLGCYITRLIHFVAKKELLKVPVVSYIVKAFDSITVDRNIKDISAAKESYNRLKRGRCLGIFPEGTRAVHIIKGRKKYKIRTGAVKLSYETGTPILPVGIRSSFKIFSKVTMVIGKPVSIGKKDDAENSGRFFNSEAKKLMDHIYGLVGEKNEYSDS